MKIKSIAINGRTEPLSNLVIIIGPNSSGKTTLLSDIYNEFISSYERDSDGEYVYSSTGNTKWPYLLGKDFFSFKKQELSSWVKVQKYWRPAQNSPHPGQKLYRSSEHILQRQKAEESALTEEELNTLREKINSRVDIPRDFWLTKFKKSFGKFLSVDERLSDINNLQNIDGNNNDNPYLDLITTKNLSQINNYLTKLLGKKMVVVKLSLSSFAIYLAQTVFKENLWSSSNRPEMELKTIEKHKSYIEKGTFESLNDQSHGTKALVSLLVSLADKTQQVVFIDEPESHIYPSGRKYLASILAGHSREKQFFVVTHDEEFLEGVATSNRDFTVIKLDKDRKIHLVSFDSRERLRTASERKNIKAIRAGFYDAALFVEGVDDKYMYSAIIRQKKLMPERTEFGLIDCDGVDKVASCIKFAKDVGTKCAVIVDFDAITGDLKNGSVKLNLIIDSMGLSASFRPRVSVIRNQFMGRPNKAQGLQVLGSGDEDLKKEVEELLKELKAVGIFVVPRGELYDWFELRNKKNELSVEKLKNIYRTGAFKYPALTAFTNEACAFLNK